MFTCSSCLQGKLAHLLLASIEHKSTTPFEIIHSNVWGPALVLSSLDHRYIVLFVDDFSRYTWVYFLKNKSEIYSTFLKF